MSIMPPIISAYRPKYVFTCLPNAKPAMVTPKATTPMTEQAMMIFTLIKANDNPTARESMLVATAKVTNNRPLVASISLCFSDGRNASQIILPPISANKINATQWSYAETRFTTVLPTSHPKAGIRAWNAPNVRAVRSMGAKEEVFV
jgi:hypothetical protein